jgi:hypothetical protein
LFDSYRLTKVVQVYFVQNNTPSHFKLHFCSVLHYHEKVENCYTEKVTWSSSSFIFKPSSSSSLLNFKIEPSSSFLNCNNVVCLKSDLLHFSLDLKSYMVEYKQTCFLCYKKLIEVLFYLMNIFSLFLQIWWKPQNQNQEQAFSKST